MPKFIGEVGVKRLWNKISEQFVQRKLEKVYQKTIFRMNTKQSLII